VFDLKFSTSKSGVIPKTCHKELWTPIVKSAKTGDWVYMDDSGSEKEFGLLLWDKAQPTNNVGEDCTIINQNFKLQNEKCLWNYCYPCLFEKQVIKFYSTL
jgi:hypothetical protein